MGYIHFTEEQKEQARRTDLATLLRSQGETVKRSGSEFQWQDGSQKVTIRGNLWFHQYDQIGGDAIDFVRRFYGKSYTEAMAYLLGEWDGTLTTALPIEKQHGEFELPRKNDHMRRVFGYLLCQRGIDRDVLREFVHQRMIYESEKYHNVVFVGYDKNGIPRHAHLRGSGSTSTFKCNAPNGNPSYSFHYHGNGNQLYVFEAPIDLLSYISMHKENWKQHSYASCCGVSDHVLFQMMRDNPNIQRVHLCFDHDEKGQTAAKRIAEKMPMEIETKILVPNCKDWNEDLLFQNERKDELWQEL